MTTFSGNGGVRAMKPGDFQATIFPGTQSGIQQALDFCSAPGGEVRLGPGTFSGITNLTVYGKTTLAGSGPLTTLLVRDPSATGTAIREKTAGEGNASGATGIVCKDFSLYGTSVGNGIDFGNQGGASFNANAYISDVLVRDFTGGFGIKLLANAIHCRDMWVANCDKGVWLLNGGANHYDGIWAEQCTTSNLIVDGSPWNTFVHVQMEQSGATMTGPMIDLNNSNSDRNVFCGVYMSLTSNLTNLIIARTGIIGTQFYGIRVVPQGHTYTNTVYTEGTASGTGAVDWIGFFNDMSSSGKHFMNDQTLVEQTVFTGARPTFPQATITTLNATTAIVSGDLTTGTAGVGNTITLGQGAGGTDSSTVRARSGSGAGAIAQFLLRQNTTDLAGFRYASGGTFIDHGGTLNFRNGISGPVTASITTAGNLSSAGSMTVGNLTSGKYPKISAAGLLIDGPTPLAGTKIYWVSDTSGGAVNRKLTFTDGILTAET